MFFAIDESEAGGTTVIGCLCFPMASFHELERSCVEFRSKKVMWSEIKWNKMTSQGYTQKFIEFASIYLENPNVTFHSWAYKRLPRIEMMRTYRTLDIKDIPYKASYSLIRSTIKKCYLQGVREFYIVADETGERGNDQYKKIKELLMVDRQLPLIKVLACTTGSSHIINALQVADLLTAGVAMSCYGRNELKPEKQEFVKYMVEMNDGLDLGLTPLLPGRINETKFHHCDIDKYNEMIR